jgi:hypothetical protein
MTDTLAVITRFLQEDDWPQTPVPGQPMIQTRFEGENGRWACLVQAREEQTQCVVYSLCPVKVPDDKLQAMAELLTRANYGLVIGNFEMDFRDGEVRYKTSIDFEGDQLSTALVRQLLYANVLTMDRYLPAIMRVIHADVSPAEAIAKVEEEERTGAGF